VVTLVMLLAPSSLWKSTDRRPVGLRVVVREPVSANATQLPAAMTFKPLAPAVRRAARKKGTPGPRRGA
jgi:hypothetical protein